MGTFSRRNTSPCHQELAPRSLRSRQIASGVIWGLFVFLCLVRLYLWYAYAMDFIFPLVSLVSESAAKTVDKLNFSRNHIGTTKLMRFVFIGMSVTLLLYVVLTQKPLPAFSFIAIGLVLLMILVSFAGNIFDYMSLERDDLSLREPMLGFEPILAGMIGYALFPEERSTSFMIAFIVSIFIVYFGTHRRRLGKRQQKGMKYLLLGVICYALLPSIYSFTLEYVSPEYVSLFRVVAILILASLFIPVIKHRHRKRSLRQVHQMTYGLTAGFIYAIGSVASLYAIQKLGVTQTMLLTLLAPALVYLSSYLILKEKVRMGEVTASLCLAVVVIAATILG